MQQASGSKMPAAEANNGDQSKAIAGNSFGDIMYVQLNNQLVMHSNLLQQLTNQLKTH